jgi:hypothetical protein
MGVLGEPIQVEGTVEQIEGDIATVASQASQAGKRIIKNGRAELKVD